MNISIAYFTNRREPRFEWFADSLRRQLADHPEIKVQLIVVDYYCGDRFGTGDSAGLPEFDDCLASFNGEIVYTPPKPTPWQGSHRLTSRDYFAASNARNTAFAYARHPYVVCVDDLSVLMPGWLDQVVHAALQGYVVCGAYKKVRKLAVNKGIVLGYEQLPSGVDSRWDRGSDTGIVPWTGAGLYGCSFGVPLELALAVNGFDEVCDGQGAEDYDFGIRIERAGARVFYNRNMLTLESDEDHFLDAPFKRESKPVPSAGGKMSDHVLLDRVRSERDRWWTLGNHFDLRQLRADALAGVAFPTTVNPTHDWRDGTPLPLM